jgi:hypothetical protein
VIDFGSTGRLCCRNGGFNTRRGGGNFSTDNTLIVGLFYTKLTLSYLFLIYGVFARTVIFWGLLLSKAILWMYGGFAGIVFIVGIYIKFLFWCGTILWWIFYSLIFKFCNDKFLLLLIELIYLCSLLYL